MSDDPTVADKPRTPFISWRRWGIAGFVALGLIGVVTLLVGILVGEDRGWMAGGLIGALTALIRVSWPLRKEAWFWGAVGVFAALDVFALIHFDWSATHSWSGHAFGGFILLDIAVMMAIVYGLYRLIYGAPADVIEDVPEEPSYAERDIL
jgi:hypothetical protein